MRQVNDFADLIFPISIEDFFSYYWESTPLVITGQQSRTYGDILTMNDVDFLLSSLTSITPDWVKFINNKKILRLEEFILAPSLGYSKRNFLDKGKVFAGFRNGMTIVLNSVQNRSQKIRTLCSHLEEAIGHTANANMYLTPSNSQGFTAHYDEHDVFILQLEGEKFWKIYERLEFPNRNEASFIDNENLNSPIHEVHLNSGDLLYIPKGYVHEGITTKTYSMHLTIGIHVLTWIDLITEIARAQPKFRQAISPRFLLASNNESLLKSDLELIDTLFEKKEYIEMGVQKLKRTFAQSRIPSLETQLTNFLKNNELDQDTIFTKRKDLIYELVEKEEKLILYYGECGIEFPIKAKQAITYILNTQTFSIISLPDKYSLSSKRVLIQKLASNGLIVPINSSG